MGCAGCGGEVPVGARFCPECGRPVAGTGDERRVITVLFADIVGFTSMSETLDPERVTRLVDSWFERLLTDITAFGGRVDKIVGDGILALFGAPVAHEDDAERAVRAALRMQETLAAIAARAGDEALGSPRIQMRIGVNTGEVLVGALRAGGSITAMGDVVNTASRLQTAARPGEVLVGPATYAATAHAIAYEGRGLLTARGREAPVEAHSASGALLPPGQRPPRDDVPLVGRDRELGLLHAAITASLGHSRALLGVVVGDTGVGKTRLAREAAERLADARDVVTLDGRCVPYGEANVWWPLSEALHTHAEVDPTDDPGTIRAAVWARVAAALGDDASDVEIDQVCAGLLVLMGHDSAAVGLDPTRARETAVGAFITFVEGHARRRPVVLCLSDIHWADDDLLVLVEQMLNRLARSPIVLLATARQAVRDHWSAPFSRHDTVVVNLDPLETEAAEKLLVALHGEPLSPEMTDELLARSGGNPFFLEELLALVEASADASRDDAHALPDTLRGIVAARLDTLGTEERSLLTNAAVIGRSGTVSALEEMAVGLRLEVDVERIVADLASMELLEVDGAHWAFRSEIAREVAYATLPKADRAMRHAGIAAHLEAKVLDGSGIDPLAPRADDALAGATEIDDSGVNRVAHHWAAAAELMADIGDVPKVPGDAGARAVTWLGAAARRAQRRDLLPAATRALDRAVELIGPDRDPRRIRLLLSRARVRAERWDLVGARADADTALGEAQATGDRSAEAAAVLRLGDIEQRGGNIDAAIARLRHAAHGFAVEGDERGRGEALRLLGMTQMFSGQMEDAAASVDEAQHAFEAAGDVAGQGWAAQNRAWIALLTGDLATTESEVGRALERFVVVDETVGQAWANGLLAFVRFAQGQREEAEQIACSIVDDASGRGDRWAMAMMRGLLGSLRLWDGDVAEALTETAFATQAFRDLGDPWGLSVALATHGRALAMSGRVEDGFAALDELIVVEESGRVRAGLGVTVSVALAVQVGEPERVAGLVDLLGASGVDGVTPAENDATWALGRVQLGQPPEHFDPAGRAFGHAVAAMVAAARGEVERALEAARTVPECPEATYLDRAFGEVAAGLALVGVGRDVEAEEHLALAGRVVEATDDLVARAVVGLARAVAAEAVGMAAAPQDRTAAELELARLGLESLGWERAFALAVAARPQPTG